MVTHTPTTLAWSSWFTMTLFYKEKQNNPFLKGENITYNRARKKEILTLRTFKYVTKGRYTSDTVTIYTFIHNKYKAFFLKEILLFI